MACPVTAAEDTASVAGQLAALHAQSRRWRASRRYASVVIASSYAQTVSRSGPRYNRNASNLAARELAEISERLQAAANALRESI
jgi:hypothetical protein